MHVGGHLRGAFCDWIDDGMPDHIPAEGPEHAFYDGERALPVG